MTGASETGKDKGIDELLDAAQLRDRLSAALRQIDRLNGVPAIAEAPTVQRIETILRARRLREAFFDAELFADPAWDILLELYAAELKAVRISVSKLCIGASVPATTALRWIRSLTEKNLIQRTSDPLDGRRHYVFLTDRAMEAMTALLKAIPPAEPLL